jgi:hypothetical protein
MEIVVKKSIFRPYVSNFQKSIGLTSPSVTGITFAFLSKDSYLGRSPIWI